MAASFYHLDNLVVFLDKNCLQATGCIADRFDTNPHREKWEAFGWQVFECDGHDIGDILDTLEKTRQSKGKPILIIAHTIRFSNHFRTQPFHDLVPNGIGSRIRIVISSQRDRVA